MALSIPEFYEFGGVDSRSNPLQMPKKRALRSRNFVIRRDGHLALRKGYEAVSMSTVTASAIHSQYPFQLLDGTKYLVYFQGTTPKVLNLATGAVSNPTVKGTPFASANRFAYYVANNRLHAVNGVDQKWFDGTTWRDIGLRALTEAEVAGVVVSEGVRELTSAEASGVTVAQGAGGSFAADTVGRLVYVALFDPTYNEVGPATIQVGSGRIKLTLNNQINLTGLPNLSTVNANWLKLLAITGDNGTRANFCTNTSANITSASRSGTTVTVICPAHGLSTGNVVIMAGQSEAAYNIVAQVTVIDVDTFTFTLASGGNSTGGTVKRIISVANATTTGTITNGTVDESYLVNQDRGVNASSVGGAQPGYQFYASIYNPTGGEHIGNRVKIGVRQKNATRCNFRITGLPDLSSTDAEWTIIVGRTGDGAEVPYLSQDAAGNYAYTSATSMILSAYSIDGASEMPLRNGLPPSLRYVARVGDRIYGVPANSSYAYRSGSEAASTTGDFVGRPEQSWSPADVEIFPTGAKGSAVAEYNYEAIIGTLSDVGVLTDQQGILGWQGPWNLGIAAQDAFCKGWRNLPYWITGDKQLATITQEGPLPISDEYEAALLAKIGDDYLAQTEIVPQRDVKQQLDRLLIKARDEDGKPFIVVHDFNLRDERSPYGQGYEVIYEGPLASDFTICKVRDSSDREVIYAGASNGKIYQLDSGAIDGTEEFTGDSIFLLNIGSSRPTLNALEWYGDKNVKFELFTSLDANLSDPDTEYYENPTADEANIREVVGEERNYHYQADLTRKELPAHVYLRIQLTSHSADAPADDLTDPPNMPVQTYGQIYMLAPQIVGAGRPR